MASIRESRGFYRAGGGKIGRTTRVAQAVHQLLYPKPPPLRQHLIGETHPSTALIASPSRFLIEQLRAYEPAVGAVLAGLAMLQPGTALATQPASEGSARNLLFDPLAVKTLRLAPPNLTDAQRYAYYAKIVIEHGGRLATDGRATVLAIRGLDRQDNLHDGRISQKYDDLFVVLTPQGRVFELSGATHPGQTLSDGSPDVDGDGVGDVGMIRPGNYRAIPNGNYNGNHSFRMLNLNGTDGLRGWRDTNHDGVFSSAERAASERRGDALTGVLFHQGNPDSPRSIGCQTFTQAELDRLIAAVGGPNASFWFTLVDAQS